MAYMAGETCMVEDCGRPAVNKMRCTSHASIAWRLSNPHKWLAQQLVQYGVTVEWYLKRLRRQDNVCAICGKPETTTRKGKIKRLAVDHDHATLGARGLLCYFCNVNLAVLEDREWRAKAEAYLAQPADDLSDIVLTNADYKAAGL
jgi:hypothetical protein